MVSRDSFDFVVVGAGIAGLRAALELTRSGSVLVVTKEAASESNTAYAQGGIAVAMGGPRDVALHLADTIAAGDGLVNHAAARVLVSEGPERVAELIEWGAAFDRDGLELARTREGAHSLPRILHADGDATGAEISRALIARARQLPQLHFAEWTLVTRLLQSEPTPGARICGVELLTRGGEVERVSCRAVVLAAGGAGQVYAETTNPAVATGDGLALAHAAGAELSDMEFYQFHPTALALDGAPRFLLSEALRGEGAWLVDHSGSRFMAAQHPLAELAPRDVVARAIAQASFGPDGQPMPVYLDIRHLRGVDLAERFPGISRFLARYGLALDRDLIPVSPAAHYLMGGVRTDLEGRTSVPGLYAAGEVACTGVHGANRLASNSLLEGLVFGARAAQAVQATLRETVGPLPAAPSAPRESQGSSVQDKAARQAAVTELRRTMWRHAGLLRDETGLVQAAGAIEEIARRVADAVPQPSASRGAFEAHALVTVARAIVASAQARYESRGAHARLDFPVRRDREVNQAADSGNHFQRHSVYAADGSVRFVD